MVLLLKIEGSPVYYRIYVIYFYRGQKHYRNLSKKYPYLLTYLLILFFTSSAATSNKPPISHKIQQHRFNPASKSSLSMFEKFKKINLIYLFFLLGLPNLNDQFPNQLQAKTQQDAKKNKLESFDFLLWTKRKVYHPNKIKTNFYKNFLIIFTIINRNRDFWQKSRLT